VALTLPPPAGAAEAGATGGEVYLLSAPPRESGEVSREIYGPVADFLSEVTGRKFVYEHPDNPLLYWENLQRNKYDILFDESHFISWLILNHQHLPMVKVSGALIYVYYINDDTEGFTSIDDLAGSTVCGQSPPNQGTLALYELFENPFRLPHLIPIEGWEQIYRAVSANQCVAGIAPLELYEQLNEGDKHPLYMTRPVPNQTFSASRRLSPQLKSQITAALLSADGHGVTSALRRIYNIAEFERAFEVGYIGHDTILTDNYQFEFVAQ
jgi:ABC-type phosphate/phosphonate transport system substrate-binding protein